MKAKPKSTRPVLRWGILAVLTLYLTAVFAGGGPRPSPMALQYDPHYILEMVAQEMHVNLRPDIPVPQVHLESTTELRRFQDAVEAQWGFRPQAFSNAYVANRNEIYLMDDADYYARLKRTPDDSLAHELVHYIQSRYLNADLNDPSCENDAIALQWWFEKVHAK